MFYSVIIKNGNIVDGTGAEIFKADVGIRGEKISKIGDLQNESADLVLDAGGFFVAPGFIDLTTHSDTHWTLFSQPNQESFIRQGITTILGGHGGCSLAPLIKKEALGALERLLDITEININWQTTKEFLDYAERIELAVNFATLVGHETLRRNILDDNSDKTANKEQIKQINDLLEKSLNDGAFGLSTNFGKKYSKSASEKEILFLFKTVAGNNAISAHHLEDEGKNLLPAISKLITFLRESGAKGHISHFKALGREAWENFENALNMIERAQKEGIFLSCDFFPYTSTGSNLVSFLPAWILAENKEKILRLLKEKEVRETLKSYLKSLTLHFDKIIIASTGRDSGSIGKSISQISKNSGLEEEEVVIGLLEANDLRVFIFNDIISPKNIEILSQKFYSMIASDGVGYDALGLSGNNLPHPRSFGAFPRAMSQFVKEKMILTWEEIIHKMSGLPAQTLGIKDRGIIKENYCADVVVFNSETIEDRATCENPFQYSAGIQYVFVNGRLTLAENNLTGNRRGKILRKKR